MKTLVAVARLYIVLALKLALWKRRNKKRFRKALKGLPPELARELEEAYEKEVSMIKASTIAKPRIAAEGNPLTVTRRGEGEEF